MANIPLDLTLKTKARQKFEDLLFKRIVGQDDALNDLSRSFEVAWVGLSDPSKPMFNSLLLGPTGVGKTLTVESIAEAIHGDPDCMIKINCAEYTEDHQVARLIGSPPGYAGHYNPAEAGNKGTRPLICPENLQRGWTQEGPKVSIILFDEIEKASPRLWELLLGILDKGEMYDGRNMRIDLTRALIFLTSNVGSRVINQESIGFAEARDYVEAFRDISKQATSAAKRKFDPEFMGRINKILVYKPLTAEAINRIINIEVWKVWNRGLSVVMAANERSPTPQQLVFTLGVTTKLNEFLSKGSDPKHGARNIKRMIEEHIVSPLATIIGTGQLRKPGMVVLDIQDKAITAIFKEQNTDEIVPAACQVIEEDDGKEKAVCDIPKTE
jgi:ATP-dependent Clp protease ATP-binding subunit ClpA